MKKTNKTLSAETERAKLRKRQASSKNSISEVQVSSAQSSRKAVSETRTGAFAKSANTAIALELVNPDARQVFVAGSFNGWQPEATPLRRTEGGRWIGNVDVNPGKYEYLFVVDGQWLPDPNAPETVQNPFGGQNSVISVSA